MFGGDLLSRKCRIRLTILTFIAKTVAFSFLFEKAAIADAADIWRALRTGGHVALLRHAIAPGTGDPDNFVIRDCRSQRNLSDEGRAQAKRIGSIGRLDLFYDVNHRLVIYYKFMDNFRVVFIELIPIN